jgi:hypothetical protein
MGGIVWSLQQGSYGARLERQFSRTPTSADSSVSCGSRRFAIVYAAFTTDALEFSP